MAPYPATNLFATVVDTVASLVCVVDSDGGLVLFNRACEELSGYSFEEARALGLEAIVPAAELPAFRAVLADVAAGGPPRRHEAGWACRDGSLRLIAWTSTSVVEGGRVEYVLSTGVDVTDARRVEAALRESEERFRTLADFAPVMIWMDDPEGKATFFNRAWLEFCGTSVQEERESNGWASVHPDDRAAALAAYTTAWERRAGYEVEYRLRRHDGAYRRVVERGAVRLEPDGSFGGLLGVAVDATDQYEAERVLRESEERYRELIENANDLIYTHDLDGVITSINRAAEQVSGYTRQEAIGMRLERLVVPESIELAREMIRRKLSGSGEQTVYDLEILTRDGQRRALEVSTRLVYEGDTPVAVQGIARDVTEARRAVQALRESELRFRELAENVDEIFWLADPDGTLLYVSPAFTTIWGRPYEQAIEARAALAEAIHPDDRERVVALSARLPEQEFDMQYRIFRPDGELRWLRDRSFHVRDEDGRVTRIAGVAVDITEARRAGEERRQLEEQMRHAQKLESLGVLAGGIAHDFNNLLMGVLGNAGLALSELPPDSPVRETVRRIETAALRASELTSQMLAYAGKGRFAVEPVDVSAVIHELAQLLDASMPATTLLRLELAPELPPVEGDASQLRRVVLNLITNAADALADTGGIVTVRARSVDLDAATPPETATGTTPGRGPHLLVEVEDTGSGMDDETKARIFEPFFTTKFPGRGLGLASTLGIVRGHGGSIVVDSTPGRGTVFRVFLPVAADAEHLAAPAEASPQPAAHGTVLVVDDEETVRSVARAALERSGFRVLTAPDGRTALDLVQARDPEIDVVLLDLTMPVLSGQEVYGELQELSPGARVVLTSGYSEGDIRTRLPGITGFIQKPYQPRELVDAIRAAIGGQAG